MILIESRFRAFSKITRGNSERTYDALFYIDRAGSQGMIKTTVNVTFALFARPLPPWVWKATGKIT